MSESSPDELNSMRKDFICGVVEGFYGRPWTTEQRKDLFQKLKKWGLDMYVYAPKDDYKHRAYWRELYTVEEAEHLTSLISEAKSHGITFCYALSPGLDITYSSQKEITTLKRKLEQVSQFGCTCFALLFDDIEPEMSEADKQIFQSFAHAQVSVTNEIHQHLGSPKFLLCPTQYCSTRAVPTVHTSEYLNTLGTKLSQEIDIMWTGPKVISKTLTTECIGEITQVLRRPPVIWDNLHANDYDQKRIFLGPYCGRSPELIPLLRGVLSNPNCEYNANMIPIWTLAHWARCSLDAPAHMEAVSWDIKLERESEQGICEDEVPLTLGKHVYHHRQALRQAINEWLPEFSIPKTAQGPVIKPQPQVAAPPVPILPILPSVNTCMSLTATTTTSSRAPDLPIPTVTTSQLQALADRPALATAVTSIEPFNPVPNPVMNSLVSPTKVILNESIPNPIIPMASSIALPPELPVSTLPVPIMGIKAIDGDKIDSEMDKIDINESNDSLLTQSFIDDMKKDKEDDDTIIVDDLEQSEQQRNGDMSVGDTPQTLSPSRVPEGVEPLDVDPPSTAADSDVVMNDQLSENGSMQVEPSSSPLSGDMIVEQAEAIDDDSRLSQDDLLLLCELFYLPFSHGGRGLRLLHDYHWLTTHATSCLARGNKPEPSEWRRRLRRFSWWSCRARRLSRRLSLCANRELHAELHPYLWDLCAVLALLQAFLRWLEMGKFPPNITTNIHGSYSWFSKGWREAFESGTQEPWVFRGGLTADLRRLLPVECSGDALRPQCIPNSLPLTVRPYTLADEDAVCNLCQKTCRDGLDCSHLFPGELMSLPVDRLIAPYLTLSPELCMVIEDDGDIINDDDDDKPGINNNDAKPEIVGYVCAAVNSVDFYRKQEIAWIPEMCLKYPKELLDKDDLSDAAKDCIRYFHSYSAESIITSSSGVYSSHPSLISMAAVPRSDPLATSRLLTCLLAALRAYGVNGVHTCVAINDQHLLQFYSKFGFTEHSRNEVHVFMAKLF
ncbi:protein O-GlcNAcase isoform X2 [Danaus plexippus]|uniref:protein O-GlcNAcase isoform X2 n=1 Tax=Danaus plexippus TaxID=13037 RepID=UPI002AB1652A|nr:protein O-GlcNAcase isoform X2 [Danaus plexippus]